MDMKRGEGKYCQKEWRYWVEGAEGEKLDNCNIISNKIYFLKRKGRNTQKNKMWLREMTFG